MAPAVSLYVSVMTNTAQLFMRGFKARVIKSHECSSNHMPYTWASAVARHELAECAMDLLLNVTSCHAP